MPLIPIPLISGLATALASPGDLYERRLLAQLAHRATPELIALAEKRQRRIPDLAPTKEDRKKFNPRSPWESFDVADLADYLRLRPDLPLWYHVANERAGRREATVLKILGVQSGEPDYTIPHPFVARDGCHCRGVKLELKRRKGGKVSTAQRERLALYAKAGWLAVVCEGAGPAVAVVEWAYGVVAGLIVAA